MVGATITSIIIGEYVIMVQTVILGALAGWVAWVRFRQYEGARFHVGVQPPGERAGSSIGGVTDARKMTWGVPPRPVGGAMSRGDTMRDGRARGIPAAVRARARNCARARVGGRLVGTVQRG